MTSRAPFYILVSLLFITGLALTIQRHISHEVPLTPGVKRTVWSVDAKVEFFANGDKVKASLATPMSQPGFTVLHQNAASPGYGLNFIQHNNTPRAEWSIREASGNQELFYKVQLLEDDNADLSGLASIPKIEMPEWVEPYGTAAQQLTIDVTKRSADAFSYTRELLKEFNKKQLSQNAELLINSESDPSQLMVKLLNSADIAARVVGGLRLEDGRRRQPLNAFVQVYEGDKWLLFDVKSGKEANRENLLLWEQSDSSLLDLVGGSDSLVTFSMIKQDQPALMAVKEKLNSQDLLNFSIQSLPIEEQALFKGILLIPFGVLVVVLVRVLVGLKTSGTFMPVLIAMAFIQTSLITGLVGFIIVVGTGLIIRSYLSRLNLLLVSRISAVIIMVILMIGLFSVVSYKVGLSEGLKITFFPMIILSWTIERMSVLWEEEGAKEVIRQGGGSLFVAVLAYLAMNNDYVRHITFNFLGVQLIIMSLVLLLGSYTGYRLLELHRFKSMVGK
ncbi:UUP1 family membrane protein [Motilimonas cestriensis]|uniref:UUP1 family membrane protein n=1 Tax=Motilimonas cestriensis TaxID=2742685 RepID=A0ABS8WFZ7_9GAMM|nr:UUP1 family membrane protein [Motilimonas cestriensis]MCE2596676.1 UUP1 family membrane protein [Motilimonas cestriensis]